MCRRGRELSCLLPLSLPATASADASLGNLSRHRKRPQPQQPLLLLLQAGEPLQISYESIHALTPFYFLSLHTRCSNTSKLYTPMGPSSFYTYHTLAHFFLKWVIQIFCHSASLPISNRLRLTAAVRKPDNIKRQIAKLPFHSHMTILGVTGGRNTQMSSLSCLPG